MTSPQNNLSGGGTYDVIFAGGGAAACVAAGRLSMTDPSLKILMLEVGPHTRELENHIQPARFLENLLTPTGAVNFHFAKPSKALAGRSAIIPTGHCLGGGSSINFMMYTRASASDYDDWENNFGNNGWGSKHLIPLLKKAETYQEKTENDTHGTSGPLKISYARDQINLAENLLEVAKLYDKDRKHIDDINDFTSVNGYSKWPRYVDAETGRRSDAAHHYIYNQEKNANLTVLAHQCVVRIIFEGTRAVGVEYIDDVLGRSKGNPKPVIAFASRLVVVSAGTLGSPGILERSGIGSAGILKKNDIQEIVDLPGVGEHYMDHNAVFPSYYASEDADSMDQLFRGTKAELQTFIDQWLENGLGRGFMSHNGLDAGIKLRPTQEELSKLEPPLIQRWNQYFANATDKPLAIMAMIAAYAGKHPDTIKGRKTYGILYFLLYPMSTGRAHITSGLDPYGALDFEPGFLDIFTDVLALRWVYKKSRELGRRLKYYRGDVLGDHPKFAKDSAAATSATGQPVAIDAPDIVYSAEDDAAIDEFHRQNIETTWHSIGTCAMKPRAEGGVVDERLNVYGVQNLKVADCSIAPENVGANTYNTAIAIGEKAAVIIAEDLGIKGVII